MVRFGKLSLNRAELVLLLAALAVLAFLLLPAGRKEASGTAYISVRGEQVMAVPLGSAGDRVISLEDEFGVPAQLEIKGGGIRFINVTCPDHICEKTGWLRSDGETAVCMPNRTAVTVAGGER